jgi:hypothetical protein
MLAATATAICTALLAGGKYEKRIDPADHCLKLQKSEHGTWEYVKDWHDGYNVHPYARIKVRVDGHGRLIPERDNATGLVVFQEISEAEYNAVQCTRAM